MTYKSLIVVASLLIGSVAPAQDRAIASRFVAPTKPQQQESAKSKEPPQIPGMEGVKGFTNQLVWFYTADSALAPQMLKSIADAAQTFTRHFGVAPPLAAVFDGVSLSAEQKSSLTAAGAVWVLPLPVSQMAAGGGDRAWGALAHELGHAWFINTLWGGSSGRTGFHYGGGAPDWLDEVAAILLENETLKATRRQNLKASLTNDETAKLIKPLSELFTMKHPGLDPAQMQEITKRIQEARARGEATSAINLQPDPQSQQKMMAFYAECRGFIDYLFQKQSDPKILRSITDTLKSGKSMDEWLAVEGSRFGLPGDLQKLQADWDAWLKKL